MSHALVRALSNRLAIAVLMIAAVVWHVESDAAQLTLSWTDNSTNEDGFKFSGGPIRRERLGKLQQ